MKAFHNDQAIKDKYLARVQAHFDADEIIHGTYWDNGKGCAVGCTIHSNKHSSYETELGIPTVLARLEDGIFEALSSGGSKTWPGRFLAAIPVGADLSMVWPEFALWLLVSPEHGVIKFAKAKPMKVAIEAVAALYRRWIGGDKPTRKEWADKRADAAAAAAAAAAYAAYAAYAARKPARTAQSEKLLQLLSAAQ